MAKPAKRRQPTKRKVAKPKASGLALSGWIVAAAVGLAWAAPQLDLWPTSVVAEAARSKAQHAEDRSSKSQLPSQRTEVVAREETAPVDVVPAARPLRATNPRGENPSTSRPIPPARIPQPIARLSVETMPSTAKPLLIMGSKIKPDTSAGMPIRKFPFITAETVTRVDDLRKVRILGGQGDWKKVEIAPGGQIGWLQLKRYEEPTAASRTTEATTRMPSNVIKPALLPAAALLGETQARSR